VQPLVQGTGVAVPEAGFATGRRTFSRQGTSPRLGLPMTRIPGHGFPARPSVQTSRAVSTACPQKGGAVLRAYGCATTPDGSTGTAASGEAVPGWREETQGQISQYIFDQFWRPHPGRLTSVPRNGVRCAFTPHSGTIFDQLWRPNPGRLTSVLREGMLYTFAPHPGTMFDQFWWPHPGRLTSVLRGGVLCTCAPHWGTIFYQLWRPHLGRLTSVHREGVLCTFAPHPRTIFDQFWRPHPGRLTSVLRGGVLCTFAPHSGTIFD